MGVGKTKKRKFPPPLNENERRCRSYIVVKVFIVFYPFARLPCRSRTEEEWDLLWICFECLIRERGIRSHDLLPTSCNAVLRVSKKYTRTPWIIYDRCALKDRNANAEPGSWHSTNSANQLADEILYYLSSISINFDYQKYESHLIL